MFLFYDREGTVIAMYVREDARKSLSNTLAISKLYVPSIFARTIVFIAFLVSLFQLPGIHPAVYAEFEVL